nr:monocarboxylate transporter 13-like isoform X2 [Crassostrea gigas]
MGKESEVLKDETKKEIVNESLQKNLNRHGENKEPEMEGPEVISTVFCISNEETGFAKSGVAKDSEEDHERLKVINQDPDPVLIKETVTRGNYGGGPQNRTKDGGFCWMVVIASFLSNFLFAGTRSCMGIIQAELEKTLEDGSAGLEWTGALVNAVPLLLAPLISAMTKFTTCGVLSSAGGVMTFAGFMTVAFSRSLPVYLVCLGLCPGLGLGMMVISSTFAVTSCFEKRRGLAMALSMAGGGLGFIVFPVLFAALLEVYGTRGTLLLCSSLYLNGIVCGAVYRQIQKPSVRNEDQMIMMEIKKAVWDKAFFRSPHSISLTLTHLMFGLSDTVPFLFLHLKAIRMGFSLELSAMLISAIGFTSLVGRVGIGILTGSSRRRRFVSFITASIVCSASMAFYAFANSYLVFIIGSCLFGISTGCLYSLLPVMLIDLFRIEMFVPSFGVSCQIWSKTPTFPSTRQEWQCSLGPRSYYSPKSDIHLVYKNR